jgi:hypothetical protein
METPEMKANARAREEVIKGWLSSSFQGGKIKDFDDLHVDQIDPAWKDRKLWLTGGLEALGCAIELRHNGHLPVDIALAFSLRSGEEALGSDFHGASGLEKEFDWSPPSLYLLKPGTRPWAQNSSSNEAFPPDFVSKTIDPKRFGFPQLVKTCYFMEFKPADSSEYSRTFLLVA